jgi:hypothetical protein
VLVLFPEHFQSAELYHDTLRTARGKTISCLIPVTTEVAVNAPRTVPSQRWDAIKKPRSAPFFWIAVAFPRAC